MDFIEPSNRNTTPERQEYMRAYAAANREAIRKHKKKWRDANKDHIKAHATEAKEAIKASKKRYYEANKARIAEKNRAYYEANKESLQAKNQEYRRKHKARLYAANQAARYGMSLDELNSLIDAQDNRCAICRTPFTLAKMNIDHCHATGAVRGLLCGGCNRGLAHFHDSQAAMKAAIKYLAAFRSAVIGSPSAAACRPRPSRS